ncbi:MAG: FIST N-terminal domain-containing protein [bacterium]
MRWASRLATEPAHPAAIEAALAGLAADLDGATADLVFAFASPDFDPHVPGLFARVRARFPGAHLVGGSAGGVIGADHEVERAPGLSLVAASLPGVRVRPFHLRQSQLPAPDAPAEAWRALVGGPDGHAIVLSDPYTLDSERLIAGLTAALPGGVVLGGLASGGLRPYSHTLLADAALHREGVAGVILEGNVLVDAVVAQGCRPVGDPMFVTRSDRNILYSLDDQPAMAGLQAAMNRLCPADRARARESVFVGVVMDPARQAYGPGDFLIRTLVGLDPRSGALVVGARLAPHAVVQFHVRDAAAAAADLEGLLRRARRPRPPAGALVFSCLGRGRCLYGVPDHDLGLIQAELGPLPVGGMFCNGEIGPVQGLTCLHGYTSAIALFRPRTDA